MTLRKLFLVLLFLLLACEHRKPYDSPGDSLPAESGAYTIEDFASAQTCAGCHPNHVAQWSASMHAYAAVDPVFIEMQKRGQEETGGKLDQFCVQCHSPVVSKLGLTPPLYENEALPPLGLEGVTCMGCHTIASVEAHRNAEVTYDPRAGMRGPISDPIESSAHTSLFDPKFLSGDLCGACHNVVNARGVVIENTHGEWEDSPAAAQNQQCQDCHMPVYRGQAAVGGPERDVHRHDFVGVDVALIDDFPNKAEQFAMVEALLQSAARMEVEVPDRATAGAYFPITVRVTNLTAGHNLPSGATADRQLWIAVTLTDLGSGTVLYRTGDLDANGDLRDRHSELDPGGDQDLIMWAQQMVGDAGNDVFFSWQAHAERTNTLAPLQTVAPVYDQFLPQDLRGPLLLEVRLRFRTFPPFLLRKLNLHALSRQIPIIDIATWQKKIPVD